MLNGLILASLPVITGLQAVLWSQIVGLSRPGAALVNIVSAAIICAILWVAFPKANPLGPLFEGNNVWFAGGYLVVSVVVALLWIAALQTSNIAANGFVEIGYPLFILLFAYLLMGKVELSAFHYVGAGMIFVGTTLVVVANHH